MLTIEDPVEYDLSPLGVSQTQADPKKGLSFAAGLRMGLPYERNTSIAFTAYKEVSMPS